MLSRFQSQNGLILTDHGIQYCSIFFRISIPKWSDFNYLGSCCYMIPLLLFQSQNGLILTSSSSDMALWSSPFQSQNGLILTLLSISCAR